MKVLGRAAMVRGTFFALAWALSGAASAVPISYTITGTGAGTVGAAAFTDATYTICINSDTTQITNDGVVWQAPSQTTITISGIGSMAVTEAVGLFNTQSLETAGFWRVNSADLLDFSNPAFGSWTMDTALGPLADMPPLVLNQFTSLATTLGAMTMSASSNVTFQARLAACGAAPPPSRATVPVPVGSDFALAMLAALLAAAGALRLRRVRVR